MTGDAKDVVRLPGRTVTEETWNTTSSLTREPYSFSKTLAEKEAWRIEQGQDRWSLVTINPGLVIGPALNADPTSESFSIARQMVSGQARFGAPRIAVAVVDVREVAYAHLAAAFLPKAQGRHLVMAETTDIVDLARRLLPAYGARYPLPRRAVPKPIANAFAPASGLERGFYGATSASICEAIPPRAGKPSACATGPRNTPWKTCSDSSPRPKR